MTNERGADGCDEGRAMRPATELERMGDRLAMSECQRRALERQVHMIEAVFHLTLDELELARRQAPEGAVEGLIEAVRDACAMVAHSADQFPGRSAELAVQRWIQAIHKARGRTTAVTAEVNTSSRPPRPYRAPGFEGGEYSGASG